MATRVETHWIFHQRLTNGTIQVSGIRFVYELISSFLLWYRLILGCFWFDVTRASGLPHKRGTTI